MRLIEISAAKPGHSVKTALLGGAALLALACGLAAPARADSLLFDRGLPTANLNNAAGANRSNVAWGDGSTTYMMGDNFTLGSAALVNDIRVWVVSTEAPSAAGLSLSLGADQGSASQISHVASGANVAATTYVGGLGYQGSGGNYLNLYQVDFAGLDLRLAAGTYAFGVAGPVDPAYVGTLNTPFLSASNAALSGSPQQGADGEIYGFTVAGTVDTANGYPFNSYNNGWDKSSDINVQVYGASLPVPEPASLLLIGSALAGLGLVRRRRPQ